MTHNRFQFCGGLPPDAASVSGFDAVVARIGPSSAIPFDFMVDLTRAARKLPFPYLLERLPDVAALSETLRFPLFQMAVALGRSQELSASDQILNEVLLRNFRQSYYPKPTRVTNRMAATFDTISGRSPIQGLSGMGSTSSMRVLTDLSKFAERFTGPQVLELALESAKLANQVIARRTPEPHVLENVRRACYFYGHLALERYSEPHTGELIPLFQAVRPIWTRVMASDARFGDFAQQLARNFPEDELKKHLNLILEPYLAASPADGNRGPLNGLDLALLQRAGYNDDAGANDLTAAARTHFASQNVYSLPPRRPS